MEEILIDCMEGDDSAEDPSQIHHFVLTDTSINGSNGRGKNGTASHVTEVDKGLDAESQFIHQTKRQQDGGESSNSKQIHRARADSSAVPNVIMMYSPDIPSAAHGYDSQLSLGNYYSKIETEENVKCVVSTVLFIFVLVIMFFVAIVLNPQM